MNKNMLKKNWSPLWRKLPTRIKLFKAVKSGRLAGDIKKRTAQKWVKRLKQDKDWNILEKQTNLINREKPQLNNKHKLYLLNFYDDNPQVRVVDTMDSLTQKFADLNVKKSTVHNFLKTECNLSFKKLTTQPAARNSPVKIQEHMDWVKKWTATDMSYLENCIFVDESGFNINMRPPSGWSLKGKPAVVATPTGRAVSHTVLGAISAKLVICMELRKPQEERTKRIKIDFANHKRKAPAKTKKPASKSTVADHYLRFLEKTMDEMDCFPELKGYYIVMDNAPIHTSDQIDKMIVARGYKSIYLPPYSPELNPIEQFWAIVKNKVKRSSFEATEDLATRIIEACNSVPPKHLQAFAQRSVNCFTKCLRDEPL
ncbi:hypothetical protein RO3G_04568 [Rhizopus delemar RA 99-880]|uniref:Tc1-like transposase DDE domain-containing protein n=1 Tax=Rhizopus delemar (strain RA 99-880 / ATCC MYA-4621 / FGSC 9543 / NRRL 43880) TaxID=246409 RepID=I1BUI3_RHIO9|nr:hypothetical protein RO3G_04568 [Rhizopus delemar RA 99-880]|eukprot:EIE79863.1 hypothetical protein RO3G_04568 [Rhizopus delemar RA 99-880]